MLAEERVALRHGHAETLVPLIERIMAKAGSAPTQLDTIAVATGPGSFTGIRVGLAAAHGIALATGARLIGVTSFAAVAASVQRDAVAIVPEAILVALDSRRPDLYVQLFAADGGDRPLSPPGAVLPEELADFVGRHAVAGTGLMVAGDAAAQAAAALDGLVAFAVVPDTAPDARGVAAAVARWQWRAGDAPPAPARPLYLRPPDVTLPKRPQPAPAHPA